MPDATDVRELREAATAAQSAADYLKLAEVARRMIELSERDGDARNAAWGRYYSAVALYQRNDGQAAKREYRAARELFETLGDREGVVRSTIGLAVVALDVDVDVSEAHHLYDLTLPIVRDLGDKRGLGIVLGNLGEIYRLEGSVAKAIRSAEESATLFRELDERALLGWQLGNIAHFRLLRHDPAGALESVREAYAELQKDPVPRWIAEHFDVCFIIAAALDRWEAAAQIYAFANRYRDDNNAPRYQGILPWFSRPVEKLSQHIETARLHELFDMGESLSVERAHELVFEEPLNRGVAPR